MQNAEGRALSSTFKDIEQQIHWRHQGRPYADVSFISKLPGTNIRRAPPSADTKHLLPATIWSPSPQEKNAH